MPYAAPFFTGGSEAGDVSVQQPQALADALNALAETTEDFEDVIGPARTGWTAATGTSGASIRA